jgi:hypothetical protein
MPQLPRWQPGLGKTLIAVNAIKLLRQIALTFVTAQAVRRSET